MTFLFFKKIIEIDVSVLDQADSLLWSLVSGGDISDSTSVGVDSGLVFSKAGVRRLETRDLNLTNAK